MIRERCSCGAEFETDEDNALKLLRDWRKTHKHTTPQELRETDSAARSELSSEPYTPELHIGFRADPFDE